LISKRKGTGSALFLFLFSPGPFIEWKGSVLSLWFEGGIASKEVLIEKRCQKTFKLFIQALMLCNDLLTHPGKHLLSFFYERPQQFIVLIHGEVVVLVWRQKLAGFSTLTKCRKKTHAPLSCTIKYLLTN
jgi:hypothetical protein